MELKELMQQQEERMNKSIESLKHEFASIRTGRASTALLDKVMVDYYGSPTPINQVANISVPEPRMILIAPWDKSMIGAIEKAILNGKDEKIPLINNENMEIILKQLFQNNAQNFDKFICDKESDFAYEGKD